MIGNAGVSYTPTSTFTAYAQWKANTYTVAYNSNGGTGSTASSTHTYDVAKNLTANGFSRASVTVTYNVNGGNAVSPTSASAAYSF